MVTKVLTNFESNGQYEYSLKVTDPYPIMFHGHIISDKQITSVSNYWVHPENSKKITLNYIY
jgi:hypothetical protein